MTRHGDYRDFVPNRFRDTKPDRIPPQPGTVVITSTGTYCVDANGLHRPWKRNR